MNADQKMPSYRHQILQLVGYAGFGDVQSMIVKIAHAKGKKKKLVPWMMKKLSKDERKILDRDMEASGHKDLANRRESEATHILSVYFNTLLEKTKCCICEKLEIMNVGENIVYFHTENNRLCTLAKTYLELLRSISPQLNLPEQTACICVECLDTIKQKYQQAERCSRVWIFWVRVSH